MTAPTETDIKMRILLAAKKLFAQQGFDGTSVRQICDEAGANVALVSYHFGGKENVFYALFDTFFPGHRIIDERDKFEHPVEGIRTLIAEVIRYRMENSELIMILQQEIFKSSPRLARIQQHVLPVWSVLRELLQKGQAQGLFHFQSLDNTMFFVMGTFLFHRNTDYFQPILSEESPRMEKLVEETLEFVFNGLKYDAHREEGRP